MRERVEEVVPECNQLVDHDWLRPEKLENGDTAYFWTQQAETALELSNLTAVERSDLNRWPGDGRNRERTVEKPPIDSR